MSVKGTKQFRLGKLQRFIERVERRLDRWVSEGGRPDDLTEVREIIAELRDEFEMDEREG